MRGSVPNKLFFDLAKQADVDLGPNDGNVTFLFSAAR